MPNQQRGISEEMTYLTDHAISPRITSCVRATQELLIVWKQFVIRAFSTPGK
jgi:hypothetical protein